MQSAKSAASAVSSPQSGFQPEKQPAKIGTPLTPGATRVMLLGAGELGNLLQLGAALLASARARTESRGAHARSDHPQTDPHWRRRLIHGAP